MSTNCWGKDIKIWDILTAKCVNILKCEYRINHIQFSPNSYEYFATLLDYGRKIRIWNALSLECIKYIEIKMKLSQHFLV